MQNKLEPAKRGPRTSYRPVLPVSTRDRTSPVVRLEGVEKWFGNTRALQGINLVVYAGDFLVLLGRNGAGKSTLLRTIARLVRPNSGSILVQGIDISRNADRVRDRLGFVAHSSYLYRNLTARENLRFFARMFRLADIESRIDLALRWVGLEESADRRVGGFSRGMLQRLSIARATLHNPEILLMDEPFTGLDLEASELLSTWMRDYVSCGKTILMATHDLEHGLEFVSRWALLEKGKIEEELSGEPAKVRERYKEFLRERRVALS